MKTALVIGGGPAGLMAAERMAGAGLSVTVADAMPSLGRKFLMAGKSGLNLTRAESLTPFLATYHPQAAPLIAAVKAFDADAVQDWARGLGQPLFTGPTGRVFPKAMKASPLLRAWFARLDDLGVTRRARWRWTGFAETGQAFDTPEGRQILHPDVTVLAMGGASWRRLGSDGAWAAILRGAGLPVTDFAPANAGLHIRWSDHMARHFGSPLKGIALHAGDCTSRGEAVISAHGLEGGGIYTISRAVRDGATVTMDLLPDRDASWITARLRPGPGKASATTWLRKAVKLDPARIALLQKFGRPFPQPSDMARLIKALPIRTVGLRPLDEAISTAGGLAWTALDDDLMLSARPGVFAAGEMLDWEAPTGGYLLTACLATGRKAGDAAAGFAAA